MEYTFKRPLLITLCTVVAPKKEIEKAILLDYNSDQVFPQLRTSQQLPSSQRRATFVRPGTTLAANSLTCLLQTSRFLSVPSSSSNAAGTLLPPHLILSLCRSPQLARWLASANISFNSLFKITFMRAIVWLAFVIFNPLP